MKKIIAIFGSVLLFALAFLASPAQASAGSRISCGGGGGWSWPWHQNGGNHDNDDDDHDNDDHDNNHDDNDEDNDTTINEDNDTVVVSVNQDANVSSYTKATVITGKNYLSHSDDGNHIMTGNGWAEANSTNVVNTSSIDIQVD